MAKAKESASGRANVAGERARGQILEAAIPLFGRHGYGGVSTREITQAASVNQAAICYHFGTKRDLYLQAVSKFFDVIAEERYAMLGAARRAGELDLEAVLRALIAPPIRFVARKNGRDYLRLFSTLDRRLRITSRISMPRISARCAGFFCRQSLRLSLGWTMKPCTAPSRSSPT